jgi:hypothetical protein
MVGSSPLLPKQVLRRVGVPLVAYHVVIFVGAFLVLRGSSIGSASSVGEGIGLIVLGVAIEGAILAWSAKLTRNAAVSSRRAAIVPEDEPGGAARRRRVCVYCGAPSGAGRRICATCGRPLIS